MYGDIDWIAAYFDSLFQCCGLKIFRNAQGENHLFSPCLHRSEKVDFFRKNA
jgi:hypothetical protein